MSDVPDNSHEQRMLVAFDVYRLMCMWEFAPESSWIERIRAIEELAERIVDRFEPSGVETLAEQHTKALERISQLEESETTWAGEDLRILRELAATMKDELQEGSYRDPLDERMANPWRKYFGLPRHFAVKPAPDCKKVRASSGHVFVEELRREPLGSPQQDRRVWRRTDLEDSYFVEVPDFLRTFAPFVEVLDD